MTKAIQTQTKPERVTNLNFVVAPYSQEAEESVIGCLLLDPNIFPTIRQIIMAEDFFLNRCAYIFRTCEILYTRDNTYDVVTIVDYLREQDQLEILGTSIAEAQAEIMRLSMNVPTIKHAEVYAHLVFRTSGRRRALKAAHESIQLLLDESQKFDDVVVQCEEMWNKAIFPYASKQEEQWWDVVERNIDKHTSDKPSQVLLPFPVPNINFKLAMEEVSLLCGLTGTGKTAFTLWLILFLLEQGKRVVFVSMEMSQDKILNRLTALLTGVSAQDIESRNYDAKDRKRIMHAMATLANYQGQFHLTTNIHTASAINRYVGSIAYTQDVDIVIVDHLKRIKQDGSYVKEHERMENALHSFQQQAKDYQCSYLLLHQIKNPSSMRDNKRPVSEDIYGGVNVENVPDNIMFIHRDDHPKLQINNALPSKVDLIQVKDRNGGGNVYKVLGSLRYQGNEQFTEWRV